MNNKTLDYYNQNAAAFIAGTVSVDFKETQDKFIDALCGKQILDFGCGSGRDTKYFIEAGLDVVATDGSEEMCKCASEYTGIHVQKMLFQELDEKERYNGIWACSSILHLPETELKKVFIKMAEALCSAFFKKYYNFKRKGNNNLRWQERIKRIPNVPKERLKCQANKGAGRMPWHWEPMKDVISCEKLRGAANKH